MVKASTSSDLFRYRNIRIDGDVTIVPDRFEAAYRFALEAFFSECRGNDSVETVFPTSSRAVGAGTLDAVPDIQSNARLEVRTRTGRDSQAIEKRVNKHPAAHLRCTQSY